MEKLAKIDTYLDNLESPLVERNSVWFFWERGVLRVLPAERRVFQFPFPVCAFPIAVGSNGRDVIAYYDDCMLYFSPEEVGIEVHDYTPPDLLAVSPYRHDCFKPYQQYIRGMPAYWYRYHKEASMAVGKNFAVLADRLSELIKVGAGERLLGCIGMPLSHWMTPLVCDVAVGCAAYDFTVVVTEAEMLLFEAVGGMNGSILALFAPGVMCAIDLLTLRWGALRVPEEIRDVHYVSVCSDKRKHYVVCVENSPDGCNVWSSEIPPINRQGVWEIPIRYTVRSPHFALRHPVPTSGVE